MKVLIKPILAFTISVFMFSVSPGIAQSSQISTQQSSELQGVQEEIIASPANTNTYTLAEVALNNIRTSCWTIVSGNVYNITSYIAAHPGGVAAISQLCGKDGTSIFSGQHQGDPAPASKLVNLKIGTLVPDATSCVDGSYLSAQIKKCVLAPMGYFVSGASATAGQTFADPCPIGSFTDVQGSGSCKLSPIGFYVDKEAQSSASPCPVGKTTESLGADSIDDCFTPDQFISCNPGSFFNQESNECLLASIGYFVELEGSIMATQCPLGMTTATSGSKSIDDCYKPISQTVVGLKSPKALKFKGTTDLAIITNSKAQVSFRVSGYCTAKLANVTTTVKGKKVTTKFLRVTAGSKAGSCSVSFSSPAKDKYLALTKTLVIKVSKTGK